MRPGPAGHRAPDAPGPRSPAGSRAPFARGVALGILAACLFHVLGVSSGAASLPEIPFPLRVQPNVGYFVPLSGSADSLFEGSPKIGILAIVSLNRALEVEAGVERAFLDVQGPSPPGLGVRERMMPYTIGLRWGGYAPRALARIFAVGGVGAYRKSIDLSGAGADTLDLELARTDFGYFAGGGFQIATAGRNEVEVSGRVHSIRGGPVRKGWDTWFALTVGYSFDIGRE